MDGITITTSSHVHAGWIPKALDNMATWATMEFKLRESKRMVSKNGKVTSRFQLQA